MGVIDAIAQRKDDLEFALRDELMTRYRRQFSADATSLMLRERIDAEQAQADARRREGSVAPAHARRPGRTAPKDKHVDMTSVSPTPPLSDAVLMGSASGAPREVLLAPSEGTATPPLGREGASVWDDERPAGGVAQQHVPQNVWGGRAVIHPPVWPSAWLSLSDDSE